MYFLYFAKHLGSGRHFIEITEGDVIRSEEATKDIRVKKVVFKNLLDLRVSPRKEEEIVVLSNDLFNTIREAKKEALRRIFEEI